VNRWYLIALPVLIVGIGLIVLVPWPQACDDIDGGARLCGSPVHPFTVGFVTILVAAAFGFLGLMRGSWDR
jgi:hypothetical protein